MPFHECSHCREHSGRISNREKADQLSPEYRQVRQAAELHHSGAGQGLRPMFLELGWRGHISEILKND